MPWLVAVSIGIAAGALSGFAARHTGLPPMVQSAASAVMALLLGAMAMGLVFYSRPGVLGGYFVVDFDNLVNVVWFLVVVSVLHVPLGLVPGVVSENRPLILGALSGLYGALNIAWLMVLASRLP